MVCAQNETAVLNGLTYSNIVRIPLTILTGNEGRVWNLICMYYIPGQSGSIYNIIPGIAYASGSFIDLKLHTFTRNQFLGDLL